MLRVIWLIVFLFSARAYAQPDHLAGKPYSSKFYFVDSLQGVIRTNSTGPEQIARAHELAQLPGKDAELAGMLRLLEYKILAIADVKKDTAAIEKGLLELLDESGDISRHLRADVLQFLGAFYQDIRNKKSLAFEYWLMAYEEYKKMPPEEFPLKRDYIYELAGAYYRYDDFRNAIRYMREALATSKGGVTELSVTMTNTIGLCYREMHNYDSALHYFNQARAIATANNDPVWTGILAGNVGEMYFLQGRNEQAIPLLEECIRLCLSHNVQRNGIMATCRLAGIYLSLDDVGKAEQTLDRIQAIRTGRPFWPDYSVAERLYNVTAKLHAAKGNTLQAYRYADSALMAKDSVHAEQTESNREKAKEKADYVQRKLELTKMASEKDRQFFIRNALIIIIILVVVIGLLFINRQRLQRKKLVAELDAATAKLINVQQEVTEPTDTRIDRELPHKEEEPDHEAISKLENATLLTNEQWDEFRKLFDKVHKGFLNNLRRKRPDLSPADIRFIALTKLRLSSKEMASMLGVSPGTIRIYKFRLRKKLGLDKEDIEDFINKI